MDAMTAQARRFYHHVHNGGVLKEHDVASMVEYMECKDAEIARLKDESAFLKDLMGQRTVTIRKLEAEREQALAASAAREIAMRERAADHAWSKRDLLSDAEKKQIEVGLSGRDYYGRRLEAELLSRSIRALPLSPDGQQALNEMLADAWDEGHHAGEYTSRKTLNPYRKDSS